MRLRAHRTAAERDESPVEESTSPQTLDDIKDELHDRLNMLLDLDPISDCWMFKGALQTSGIGIMRFRDKAYTVPRLAMWAWGDNHFDLDDRKVLVWRK